MFDKMLVDRLFSAFPSIKKLLLEIPTYQQAREKLLYFCNELWMQINHNSPHHPALEWELQMRCLRVFKNMLSERSERLAEYSVAEVLWHLAHDNQQQLPADLSDNFLQEIVHIFLGITGKTDIYQDTIDEQFEHKKGRKAAILRSNQLDILASKTRPGVSRYPSGLDKDVIARREKNKMRILKKLNAQPEDWDNYLWQIRNVIRNAEELENLVTLSDEERTAIQLARENRLPFGITPYYVSLMDEEAHRQNDHAVRAQVIPPLNYVKAVLDNRGNPEYHFDFMMEHETSPIDLITRRYPHIVILKPYNTCSQICVYCQRNWEIEDVLDKHAFYSREKIKQAIDWIAEHENISEVLVTGGDPLVMNDDRLAFVLKQVAEIDHVERIRIGTRTPVVLPQRFTESMMDIIQSCHEPGRREVTIVTHFEHPYEITPEAMQAVQKIKKCGISVYNQAVFTMENSRRYELVALRRLLRLIGVDPYYTFNTKGKKETKNYRVPLARLLQEIQEESRLMPGQIRTDEAVYNVPKLGKNYIRAGQHHSLLSILPTGERLFEFHPWEKNIRLTDTYVDKDVPLYEYLQELQRRGENPQDYKSIWYYF